MLLAMRIIFAVSLAALAAVLLAKKLSRPIRSALLVVCLLCSVGSLVTYGVITRKHQQTAHKSSNQTTAKVGSLSDAQVDKPTQPAGGKLADHELVNIAASSLSVYTREKDSAKLVQLNDELWSEYGQNKDPFRIDYFDDKAIAKDYFTAVTKPGLPDAEKQRLISHYVAFMIYNSTLKRKELDRQGVPIETLKKY